MHVEETPDLYRTMNRFRAVAVHLAHHELGHEWFPELEGSVFSRWRHWLRRAYRAARREGKEAERLSRVSRWRQMIDLVHVQRRLRLPVPYYYYYRLFERDRYRRCGLFVLATQMQAFLRYIDATIDRKASLTISDKARFRVHCLRHGLPSIPTIAVFSNGDIDWHECDRSLPRTDLFAKPVDLRGGEGAITWRYHGSRYHDADGRPATDTEVLAQVVERSHAMPYLLQPRMRNHPATEQIVGETLASLRLMTHAAAGRVESLAALFCLPREGAVASNTAAGGMIASVDMGRGRLVTTGFKTEPFRPPMRRHPVTDAPLCGTPIPGYDEMQALAERAHATLPEVPMLGWDLAFTPEGPIIIEVNLRFGVETFQVFEQPPMALTGIPQIALAYYDAMCDAE